jgi:hypothetical protein
VSPLPSLIHDEQRRINLLSDTVLYQDAVMFVSDNPPPKQSQLTGLLQFSRTWSEIKGYINHQRNRDWGRDTDTPAFYEALRNYLYGNGAQRHKRSLETRISEEFGLIDSEALTKQERRDATEAYAGMLATAFVQHIVCAALFARTGRGTDDY